MVSKLNVIEHLLGANVCSPILDTTHAFAPTNIALIKYWGKRNVELNLPINSSLSISLGDKGVHTSISLSDSSDDTIILNNNKISLDCDFAQRMLNFINLFRKRNSPKFNISTTANIPIAAGLASSAAGFAALVLALKDLYGWDLSLRELSVLARMGSGSACRSLQHGFVRWDMGTNDLGLDSCAYTLEHSWGDLCVGLIIVSSEQKKIGSSIAMQQLKQL